MTGQDAPGAGGPQIFAIVNQKGGVGKTTTAINLGTGLARSGHAVLVVDLDPQGNASTGLGCPPEERGHTSYEMLTEGLSLDTATTKTMIDRLSLVPASVDLAGVDVELVDDPTRSVKLKALIEADPTTAQYDYILIDCPPSLNLLTINAMTAAAAVIVPLQCEFFALEGLSQLLGTIRQVQQRLNPALRVHGIVLTMFDRRNRLSFQVAEDVRENLGDVVYQTVIPRNVRLSEAPSHAMPAILYDPDCAGSVAYLDLASEIIGRDRPGIAA